MSHLHVARAWTHTQSPIHANTRHGLAEARRQQTHIATRYVYHKREQTQDTVNPHGQRLRWSPLLAHVFLCRHAISPRKSSAPSPTIAPQHMHKTPTKSAKRVVST